MARKQSRHPDKVVCECGRGYAATSDMSPHKGKCSVCYVRGMTCRERKAKGLKLL